MEAFAPCPENKGGALPKAWILPLRLAIYLVLAACSGYIYFNIGKLGFTHRLLIVPIVAVSAMALLDCRVNEGCWQRERTQVAKNKIFENSEQSKVE